MNGGIRSRVGRWWAVTALAVVGAASSAGCGGCIGERATMGELGVAEFAYNEGLLGCIFGCNAEESMAERSRVHLLVLNWEDLPDFTVSSSDPGIATFTHDPLQDESTIVVETGTEGDVVLTLTDTGGELVDRLTMRVRAVDTITLEGPEYVQTLTIMVGGSVRLSVGLAEANGDRLVGVGGVDYAFTGGIAAGQIDLVEAIAEAIVSLLVGTVDEWAELDTVSIGDGSIVISAPSGASATVPVAVVDAAAVERVTVSCPDEPLSLAEDEDYSSCSASGFGAGDEPVYSVDCAWTIDPAAGPVAIDLPDRDYVGVQATGPGSATLSCTVGAATGSDTITFQ